jgi:hypothetical protein
MFSVYIFRSFGLKFKELNTKKARRQDKMEGNKYTATYFPSVIFIFILRVGLDVDLFAILLTHMQKLSLLSQSEYTYEFCINVYTVSPYISSHCSPILQHIKWSEIWDFDGSES